MNVRVRRSNDAIHLDIWGRNQHEACFGIRISNRHHRRLFSERHQITARWHYALGGRIAIRIRPDR